MIFSRSFLHQACKYALMILLMTYTTLSAQQTRWHTQVDESITQLSAQDTSKAEKLLRSALKDAKDTGSVYLYRGTQRSLQRDYIGALSDLNIALEHVNSAVAYMTRGQIFSALKKYDDALLDFDIAISIDTANPLGYMYRGTHYSKMQKIQESNADFAKALSLAPHNVDVQLQQAFALIRLQQSTSALVVLDHVIQNNPAIGEAYFVRGSVYHDIGKHALSCTDWKTAAQLGYRGAMSMIRQFCNKDFSKQELDSLSTYAMETVEVQGERVPTEIVIEKTKNLAYRGERALRLMNSNFNPATIFGGRNARLAQGAGSLNPGGTVVGLPDAGYCSGEATRTTDLGIDCLIVLLRENINALNDERALEMFRRLSNMRNQLREALNGFLNGGSTADRVRTPAMAIMEQMSAQMKELLVYIDRLEKERQ